jgi:hypothetical protein
MRLKVFVVFLFVAGLTGTSLWYWSDRKPAAPEFDGPRAELQLQIWHYAHAEDLTDKVKWAIAIQTAAAGWSTELPERDLFLKRAADRYVEEVRKNVSAWESTLTRDDINSITETNPSSIYRKAGRLRSVYVECSEADYQSLRSHFDLRDLDGQAYLISQWIAQSEAPFEQEYAHHRLELLKDDNYWIQSGRENTVNEKTNRELMTAWFLATSSEAELSPSVRLGHLLTQGEAPKPAEKLADGNSITVTQAAPVDFARELEAAGVSSSQIYERAVSYAVAAPDCMIGPHPDFVRRLRTEITVERGKALMEKLAQWMGETGQADASFSNLPLDHSDLLFGSALDAWGREYIFKRDETSGVLKISSFGDDPLAKKSEIYIGQIEIPSPSDANIEAAPEE